MTTRDAIGVAPATLGVAGRTVARTESWQASYARRLLATDIVVLFVVVFATQWVWIGTGAAVPFRAHWVGTVSYTAISLFIVAVWLIALGASGSRNHRVIGSGSDEYRRVFNASLTVFGLIAIVAFIGKVDLARGYVLVAFPVGILALLLGRWVWRQWLREQRRNGAFGSRVLLVGSTGSATEIARSLAAAKEAGYFVVGACVSASFTGTHLPNSDVPVVGTIDQAFAALQSTGADTVCVTGSSSLTPAKLRRLSWQLEPGKHHLVVVPGMTDVSGHRIHARPVAGLPLMHVETPRFDDGSKLAAKRTFDVVVAGLAVVVLSPVLAGIALAVKLTSPGPVLFRQPRVGRNGETFTMLKFRSMVVDAEERLAALVAAERAEGNTVLFKMKDDPRVTRIGRVLRRYSLDELPQFFNVLGGSMSLVGPRPPLAREVEQYEVDVHRRFLVKPGITGLWQVSGRSHLSWEESVRMDLYYVENWSLTGDITLLWRTVRAVLASDGAY